MLDAAVKTAKLDRLLDENLSVEAVGIYKPHPKVQLAVDRLGVSASAIAFQSSNAYAASAFGMQVIWCNRYGQRREPFDKIAVCRPAAFSLLRTFLGERFERHKAVAKARGAEIQRISRDKQLQYIWLRAAQGRHADFWQVTGDALDLPVI
jgi:hypothetical protein